MKTPRGPECKLNVCDTISLAKSAQITLWQWNGSDWQPSSCLL